MSTTEDLKSMSQEELVERIQKLEVSNKELAKEKDNAWKYYSELKAKFDSFSTAIKSITSLV